MYFPLNFQSLARLPDRYTAKWRTTPTTESDKVKNRKTAGHTIMNQNEAPLRNILESCSKF